MGEICRHGADQYGNPDYNPGSLLAEATSGNYPDNFSREYKLDALAYDTETRRQQVIGSTTRLIQQPCWTQPCVSRLLLLMEQDIQQSLTRRAQRHTTVLPAEYAHIVRNVCYVKLPAHNVLTQNTTETAAALVLYTMSFSSFFLFLSKTSPHRNFNRSDN